MVNFSAILLDWASQNPRPMPWKGERDAYKIWLSEIILQQTRVAQGLPYYEKFIAAYPTVTDLANAPSEEVMRLWQGLGYYSRARNLHETARYVTTQYAGVFPTTFPEIRALKGIGDYTAAAIASFAFDLPFAVVDGNVYRVLARIFGIFTPIDSTAGKKEFAEQAQKLLGDAPPAHYNQAIIDFGATHCTPLAPSCSTCPFQGSCRAFQTQKTSVLPVKAKKKPLKNRYFHYFYFGKNDHIWLQKRTEKDIWQDLWQFPMIEYIPDTGQKETIDGFSLLDTWQTTLLFGDTKPTFSRYIETEQVLSHQKIISRFYCIDGNIASNLIENEGCLLVATENLPNFAFPKSMIAFFEQFKAANYQAALF